jgi:endoglucanase
MAFSLHSARLAKSRYGGGLGIIVSIGIACLVASAIQPGALALPQQGDRSDAAQGFSASPGRSPHYAVGARLLDADGQEVRLTGVNWFGFETESFAPHGLWARGHDEMVAQMAGAGFNTIRLPFSNQLFEPQSRPQGIDYRRNPELQGLSGLALMDRIVEAAGRHGLAVILDRHRPTAAGQSELWYTDRVPEDRWIADWVMLAQHYRGNAAVIGADLHNEPHGRATWGDDNRQTDWRLAAERAGNAILAANPDWLIVVEGVERYGNDWYWWGGNLVGARQFPVRLSRPEKLVYSPHDYGPGVYQQPWFRAPDFPDNLRPIWRHHWGYLQLEGIAPVLVGEFGGRSVGQDREGVWQQTLVSFLQEHGISYTYWSWNPDSRDTGGVLRDDWSSLDQMKLAMLARAEARGLDTSPLETLQPAPGPTFREDPAPVVPVALPVPLEPAPSGPSPAGNQGISPQPGSVVPPGARFAPGGPFDPDPQHVRDGIGGRRDPDPAHREARAHDEYLYLRFFGTPWPYAEYATGGPAVPYQP